MRPTPHEFLSRVVAWPGEEPGYVNIHTFRADKPSHNGQPPIFGAPFRDVQDAINYAQQCAAQPGKHSAVYFCTSTQTETKTIKMPDGREFVTAKRNKQNARWLKAIWLEIDVKPDKKNAYHTDLEAMDAVYGLMAAAKLPGPSAIVHSGGGFHVYWISDRRLTLNEWQGYADGLKDEAKKFGLKADLQCTADAARILRVPGTFNLKYGAARPVKIKHLGQDYDFGTTFAHIRKAVTATVTVPGAVAANPFPETAGWKPLPWAAGLTGSLSEGIDRWENLPLDPQPMFKQCQHFRATMKGGGKHDPEPLWMLNLLAASFLDGGEKFAHALSCKYPTYTPEETDRKYAERLRYKAEKNLGWPSCANFEAAGAKCQGCPLRGNIRSPLNLCIAKPVAQAAAVTTVQRDPLLPEPYVLVDGFINEIITKKIKDNETVEERVPLFMSRLRNFSTNKNGNAVEFKFDVNLDMDNWEGKTITEDDMASEQRLMAALRRYPGVKPYPRNKGRIEQFMTSFMKKLDEEDYRSTARPFGWLYDPKGGEIPIGFAYNGKCYMADGSTSPAGAADPTFGPLYLPKGDAQSTAWYSLINMITARHHPALEAVAALGFAAPLVACTNLRCVIVSGYSPGAGTGKTTSLETALAIWGEPLRTKEKPNTTPKGIMHKAGEIRNLPIALDEVSDPHVMNMVRKMLGGLTEGGLGTRLKSDRTAFAYDTWQTALGVCANQSLIQNILENVTQTDAQLQRVFEFEIDQVLPDTTIMKGSDVDALRGALDYNYGYIGDTYAQTLGRNPGQMWKFVKAVLDKFVEETQAPTAARFRCGAAAVLWAGAALANSSVKTKFNLGELWDFLKREFVKSETRIQSSEVVAGRRTNTVNAMTQFFKTKTRNTLWMQRMPTVPGKGRPWAITYRSGPCAQRPDPIHVRCAEYNGVIEISKHNFFEYCQIAKVDSGTIIQSLIRDFGAVERPRIDLSYGSGVAGGRETIISIPVGKGPFAGVLYKHCPPDERPPGVTIEDEGSTPVTAPVTDAVSEQTLLNQAAAVKAETEKLAPKGE